MNDGQSAPLRDGHGRLISSLRLSVTDRCNFRCQYCMPAEGLPWLQKPEVLSFEECERLVRIFASIGIDDLRLTGGEPLVRREFPKLVGMLSRVPGIEDLSLTTNAYLLKRDLPALAENGLKRINVSLDSLSRDRFFEMTRRDSLAEVLEGLEAAEEYPQLHPIKINCVAMRGFTEEEVISFAELARRKPYEVRFIEFMPLDASHSWSEDDVLTGPEIYSMIDAVYPLKPSRRPEHSTSRVHEFADGNGRIGFVNPVSEPFCSDCNRIRVTADGKLRTCLFSMTETDLREPLRDGSTDAEIERIIREAVWRKELKHHISEPGFKQPARTMSSIGG